MTYGSPMTEEEVGPRQRAAETKRRRTREQIIASTLDLYGRLQEGDYTRDQIAESAGVGAATVHGHFGTKYEVLRAAYERLIAPFTEPILAKEACGTYDPADAVVELGYYIYGVAKLSQSHRALTVAMIRSYFEVPLKDRPDMVDVDPAWGYQHRLLGGPIARPMIAILEQEPFSSVPERRAPQLPYTPHGSALYHCNGLLMNIYHAPEDSSGTWSGTYVLDEVLRVHWPSSTKTEREEYRIRAVKLVEHQLGPLHPRSKKASDHRT